MWIVTNVYDFGYDPASLRPFSTLTLVNLKSGFHRIFFVCTAAWLVWCIFLPVRSRSHILDLVIAVRTQQEDICQTSDCRDEAKAEESREFKENSLRKWYAMEWPIVLLYGFSMPILVYGSVRGTAALVLWVKRGFKPQT